MSSNSLQVRYQDEEAQRWNEMQTVNENKVIFKELKKRIDNYDVKKGLPEEILPERVLPKPPILSLL